MLFAVGMSLSTTTVADQVLRINGFLSAGFGAQSTDEISIASFDEDLTVKEDTVFGVQLNQQINEQFSLTGQLVGRGNEDYDIDAAWAYVSYQLSPETNLKAGRMQLPLFHISDFKEVGYAYNWVRPPAEVYRFPFASVDSIDINHQFKLGGMQSELQFYAGHLEEELRELQLQVDNILGVIGRVHSGNWSLRASYHQSQSTADLTGTPLEQLAQIDSNFEIDRTHSDFTTISGSYDCGTNYILAEWTALRFDSAASIDDDGWLIHYGRRFKDLIFHLTYAELKSHKESGSTGDLQSILENNESSVIAGVRYDIEHGVALKFEVQYHDEETVEGIDGEQGYLYSTALDMVF